MNVININDINGRIRSDAQSFVTQCDAEFADKITSAAVAIRANINRSPIVLLSGPSGSGKTTTAMKINERLSQLGVRAHVVSLDNYFVTVNFETAPRTPEGELDYESPLCLDMELLNEHFDKLSRGEEIHIPQFIFSRQKRSASTFTPLKLEKNEIAIFEGIHALNDEFAGRHPEAFKLYISASSKVSLADGGIFDCTWVRLMRRIVRDNNFRGAGALFTLKLWHNVLRGEQCYIDPFKHKADLMFDSFLPYEISVLKGFAKPLLDSLLPEYPELAEIAKISACFDEFESLPASIVPTTSLLREFIGGSSYQYT